MHGRIHNLRYHYRTIGAPGTANVLKSRLDRLGKQQVAEACAEALDQAMGDDPTVYVIRRVTSRLALRSRLTDEQIARSWGRQMAKAIMQRLAGTGDDSSQVVQFESQAVYVAHFIADLLENRAWSHWYYTPFQTLQALPPQSALQAVLAEHHAELPAILAALHRSRALDPLLAALEPAAQQALWTNIDHSDSAASVPALRPLFVAALHLAEQLQLGTLEQATAEALLAAYARRSPPIDWRDTRSLALTVIAMLRWLFDRGDVFARPRDTHWRAHLAVALTDLDWLDTLWLQDALEELLSPHTMIRPELPARPPAAGPTARQRQLCADLAAVLRSARLRLDPQTPDSPANRLRLYAALLDRAPQWAGDSLADQAITQAIVVWAWAEREQPFTNALRMLQEHIFPATSSPPARPQLPAQIASFLASFGTPGLAVVELLAAGARPQSENDVPAFASGELSLSPYASNTQGLPVRQSQHSASSIDAHTLRDNSASPIDAHTLRDNTINADTARPDVTRQLSARPPSPAASNKREPPEHLRQPGATTGHSGFDVPADAAAPLPIRPTPAEDAAQHAAAPPPATDTLRTPPDAAAPLPIRPTPATDALHSSPDTVAPHAASSTPADVPAPHAASSTPAANPLRSSSDIVAPLPIRPTPTSFGGQVLESQCAGVLLLLRSLLDTRLPTLISQVFAGDHAIASAYLMGLGMCWAGQAGARADQIDPAVALLAGTVSAPQLDQVRDALARCTAEQHAQIQTALLRTFAGQRVVRGDVMQLYEIPFGKHVALIAGDETDGPLLFGSLLDTQSPPAALIADWQIRWQEATGRSSACLTHNMHLEASDAAAALHHTRSTTLSAALKTLEAAHLGLPHTELAIALTALALVRVWARWLRQFSQSSVPYLLTNFIRRPGRLVVAADSILVQVVRGPLDIVLEMSGYTAAIEHLPWLGRRHLRYQFI
ncbi:MAG TPA: hypothetical protein VGD58_28465 [Herpetosiphonaceae bacterium]